MEGKSIVLNRRYDASHLFRRSGVEVMDDLSGASDDTLFNYQQRGNLRPLKARVCGIHLDKDVCAVKSNPGRRIPTLAFLDIISIILIRYKTSSPV